MTTANAVGKATLKKNSRKAADVTNQVKSALDLTNMENFETPPMEAPKVAKSTTVGKTPVKKPAKGEKPAKVKIIKGESPKAPRPRNVSVYKTYRETSKPFANGKSVLYAHEEGGPKLAHGVYSSKVWLHRPTGTYLATIWKHYFEVKNIGGRWTTFEHIYSTPEEYQAALEKWCQANNVPVEDGAAV